MVDWKRGRRNGGGRRSPNRISPWLVAAIAIVVAMVILGLEFWALIVVAIGVIIEGTRAAASDRVKELFARKPDLQLVALAGGSETIEAVAGLPPYPFDLDRLIANEVAVLRRDGRAYAKASRNTALAASAIAATISPWVRQPQEADYEEAWNAYLEDIDSYAADLREWLLEYHGEADLCSRTFTLQLQVISAPRGAFAEHVRLEIALPEGFQVVGEMPTIDEPPCAPSYEPPRAMDVSDRFGIFGTPVRYPRSEIVLPHWERPVLPAVGPTWAVTRDGRQVELALSDIQAGRTAEIEPRLRLRAPSQGRFALDWRLLTSSGGRHCEGTLFLLVPTAEDRLPFKRLEGILKFPDVPILDGAGDVVRPVRTEDPAQSPPAATTTRDAPLLERMADVAALNAWQELGLGDDVDETDEVVRVRRAADGAD